MRERRHGALFSLPTSLRLSAWSDFHARSHFARSFIPGENGTTRGLFCTVYCCPSFLTTYISSAIIIHCYFLNRAIDISRNFSPINCLFMMDNMRESSACTALQRNLKVNVN